MVEDKKDIYNNPKIVLLANYNIQSQAQHLIDILFKTSLDIDVSFSYNDDLLQDIFNPESLLYASKKVIANIIFINPDNFINQAAKQEYLLSLQRGLSQYQNEAPIFIFWMPVINQQLEESEYFFQELSKNVKNIAVIKQGPFGLVDQEIFDYNLVKLINAPYTSKFENSVAINVIKRIRQAVDTPYKVIVVDADNTLWQGICAENSLNEIKILESHKELQKFLLECEKNGFLICIASKNIEDDFFNVLEHHPNMLIKRENIADWEINWNSKADNLSKLAKRLNLSLDSFIFIDDKKEECVNISSQLPNVMSLCLGDEGLSLNEIKRLWAFDAYNQKASKTRTKLYHENSLRVKSQEQFRSYGDYIQMLNLNISFKPLERKDIIRVSELSYRTTQFNCSNKKYSETQLSSNLNAGANLYAIKVSDNFGDYGIVGFISFIHNQDSTTIDNFFLSCRSLNKGIEHEIIRKIAMLCPEYVKEINFVYNQSNRNIPAKNFLEEICSSKNRSEETFLYTIKKEDALNLSFNPLNSKHPSIEQEYISSNKLFHNYAIIALSQLDETSEELSDKDNTDNLERVLTEIIVKELKLQTKEIAQDATIFSFGASSLNAAKIAAAINHRLSLNFGIKDVYENDSINKMHAFIQSLWQSNRIEAAISGHQKSNLKLIPASINQKNLFLIDKIEPAWWYNTPSAFLIEGELCYTTLSNAFEYLISIHPQLKVNFIIDNGQLYFKTNTKSKFSINFVEMPGASEQEIIEFCKQKEKELFDLSKDLLIKVILIRNANKKHILFINMHHIISDGWSDILILKQLSGVYNYLQANKTFPVRGYQEENSYETFCQEQFDWLNSKDFHDQLAYWKEKLKDSSYTQIKPDFDREDLPSHVGTFTSFNLDPEVYKRVKNLASELKTTFFNLALTVFNVLVHKYTNQDDILICCPFWNRPFGKYDKTVGYFVNLVLLRANVKPDLSLLAMISDISKTVFEAQINQGVPFPIIVEQLRDRGALQNFNEPKIAFSFQQEATLEFSSIKAKRFYSGYDFARFDLVFELTETSDGITGGIYHTSNYSNVLISGFINAYIDFISNLEQKLALSIRLIQLKTEKNIEHFFKSISPQFEVFDLALQLQKQVQLNPNRIALRDKITQLTYKEVDEITNTIAENLQNEDYQSGDVIGISLNKSIEQILAAVALAKLGIAYIGLDPAHPNEYLLSICKNSNLKAIITNNSLIKKFETLSKVYSIETLIKKLSQQNGLCIRPIQPNNILYILYTSGTTGAPKGVMISHENFYNLLIATQDTYHFAESDKILFFHSFGFDVGQWEIWSALLNGSELVIPDEDLIRSPLELADFLTSNSVTILNQTPSAFEHLCDALHHFNKKEIPSLRLVIFAGESLNTNIIKKFPIATSQEIEFYNMYGITEVTVHTTIKQIDISKLDSALNNVGTALKNTAILILDENLQVKPIGAIGEIYVAGYGVAKGYYNNADLTKRRFLNLDQFHFPVYKSGDLGRYLGNGEIEFFGRIDDQIKLRGYRIDLKEIANTINEFEGVKSSIVLEKGEAVEKRVCAFIIPNPEIAYPLYKIAEIKTKNPDINFYNLPNNLSIAHLNPLETDTFYQESFIKTEYIRNGITVQDGDTIFDIGANIGMFSLSLAMSLQKAKIYAFEPIQSIYEILNINKSIYNLDNLTAINLGLSHSDGELEFTYYPYASALSTACVADEKEVMSTYIKNKHTDFQVNMLESFIEHQLNKEIYQCKVITLSNFITKNNIHNIDLLKIDVERSEFSILTGIDNRRWNIINQIVMEVHDIDGNLNKVKRLLEEKNFDLTVEQNEAFSQTNLFMLFAIKKNFKRQGKKLVFNSQFKWNRQEDFFADLQTYLKANLPDYMLPSEYSLLAEIPLTINGKLDKKRILSQQTLEKIKQNAQYTLSPLENEILKVWQLVLKKEDISPNDNFFEVGGNSLLLMSLFEKLEKFIPNISITDIFKYPSIRKLADSFTTKTSIEAIHKKESSSSIESNNDDIAVIGYAFKLPSSNEHTLWRDLVDGKCFIKNFSKEELSALRVPESIVNNPNYVPSGSLVEDVSLFDAEFFGIFPADARLTDPQHRVFMELAWEALENSGYSPDKFTGEIGISCGVGTNHYIKEDFSGLTFTSREVFSQKDYLATKIAHKLGLRGPAINVNTACSTGLVNVIKACQSLILGDADIMLAGAATLLLPNQIGYLYEEGGVLSRKGESRPFDQNASGIVPGSGAVIFVLKKLSEALKDNDKIHAVIKGFALNNDGNDKVSFAAPSINGQKNCIKKALKRAKVNPENIVYVETHGTGTKLGDSVELRALEEVYKEHTNKINFCTIGSIKANFGHTDSAAGALGLLKAIMVLENKAIPQQINCTLPILDENSPFQVNKNTLILENSKDTFYAAVSSFGVGGTNAHMIIQSAPQARRVKSVHLPNVLLLSAKSETELEQMRLNLCAYLEKVSEEELTDSFLTSLCYTLQCRSDFQFKAAYIVEGPEFKKLLAGPFNKASEKVFGQVNSLSISMQDILSNWLEGKTANWSQCYGEPKPYKLSLPTYPFTRKKHWNNGSEQLNKGGQLSIPEKTSAEAEENEILFTFTHDEVKANLLRIFADSLGYDEVDVSDNFQDLGGDSLIAISILSRIEKELGFKVTIDDIYSPTNLEETINKIMMLPFFNKASDHVICLKIGSSKLPPIFIIHPGNGGLFHYRTLLESFHTDRTIFGIENQIFNDTYQSFDSLENMATCYIKRIKHLQPTGPYLLAGWSFGGSVAFEMARQLELLGDKVAHVMLLDSWGKHNNLWSSNYFEWAKGFMQYDHGKEEIFINRFYEISSLLTDYQPKPINSKVILFKAEELDEEFKAVAHDSNHWDEFVNNELLVIPTTGSHLSMVNKPHVIKIMQQYKNIIDSEAQTY